MIGTLPTAAHLRATISTLVLMVGTWLCKPQRREVGFGGPMTSSLKRVRALRETSPRRSGGSSSEMNHIANSAQIFHDEPLWPYPTAMTIFSSPVVTISRSPQQYKVQSSPRSTIQLLGGSRLRL
jgi:hypothetical protein